jgi:hypothetical protein
MKISISYSKRYKNLFGIKMTEHLDNVYISIDSNENYLKIKLINILAVKTYEFN